MATPKKSASSGPTLSASASSGPPGKARRKAAGPPQQDIAPRAKTKVRVSQSDVPGYPLEQAMRVPLALRDQYAKQPTDPLDVAKALNMSPTSGPFRTLTGAAVAYGLTTGGGQTSKRIGLTTLGHRAVAPLIEGDDLAAQREAFLKPRVLKEFLTRYDGNVLPTKTIALNVLDSLGVPSAALERTYDLVVSGARGLGFLDEIAGKTYVRLESPTLPTANVASEFGEESPEEELSAAKSGNGLGIPETVTGKTPMVPPPVALPEDNDRVFITHGSNMKIVDQIKEVLTFGKFTPVVSVELESLAKPVPDKVLDDMSSCGAAIIHVGSEMRLLDDKGKEHVLLNPNVLIEIGAAMMRFRRRFILLVERGVKLPSNLQGLYEVRYEGDELDYSATMKLLRAFNEFREQ